MQKMSLDDDWVDVSEFPLDYDKDDGHNYCLSVTEENNISSPVINESYCDENSSAPNTSKNNILSTGEERMSCQHSKIDPSSIIPNDAGTFNCGTSIEIMQPKTDSSLGLNLPSASTIEHTSDSLPSPPTVGSGIEVISSTSEGTFDERDAKITLLEQRIRAMEQGIRSIHTLVHANSGIRQALNKFEKNVKDDCDSISMPSHIEDLPEEVSYELTDILESTQKLGAILTKRSQEYPKLSFLNFQVGDIALFMPVFVDNRRIWMAFNSGSPNFYLSEDSLQVFLNKSKQREQRSSIIGRLVFLETKKAETASNIYQLAEGTEYHLCYAEPLYRHNLPPKVNSTNNVASPTISTYMKK